MSDEPGGKAAPIVPVEQKSIDFYGDELVAVRDEEGTVWVPIRRLCEAIGVTLRGQLARIERSDAIRDELRSVYVTYTDGRRFAMECLPVKWIRFWLAGVDTNRATIKPHIREKLIQYQREVADIIDQAFTRAAPLVPTDVDEARMVAMRDLARQQAELMRQQADLWDAMIVERRRLSAVQELAEEHEEMIQDLARQMEQVRSALAQVQDELRRLQQTESSQLRLLLPPAEARLTPEQKATIRGLVEDLVAAADARGARLWGGKNNYQAVYATLNRTFNVAKYEELTQAQYPRAVEWLKRELARIEAQS